MMLSWGFSVHTIVDSASKSLFSQLVASSKCVFIGEEVNAASVSDKLVSAPIGVVFEEYALVNEFGIAPGMKFVTSSFLNIVNRTHYIVSTLGTGGSPSVPVHIFPTSLQMSSLNSGWAPGLTVLGQHPSRSDFPSLLAIRKNGTLMNGSLAAGRRVMLPWGHESQDFNTLNSNGLTIMRRSLEWAMGLGSD